MTIICLKRQFWNIFCLFLWDRRLRDCPETFCCPQRQFFVSKDNFLYQKTIFWGCRALSWEVPECHSQTRELSRRSAKFEERNLLRIFILSNDDWQLQAVNTSPVCDAFSCMWWRNRTCRSVEIASAVKKSLRQRRSRPSGDESHDSCGRQAAVQWRKCTHNEEVGYNVSFCSRIISAVVKDNRSCQIGQWCGKISTSRLVLCLLFRVWGIQSSSSITMEVPLVDNIVSRQVPPSNGIADWACREIH